MTFALCYLQLYYPVKALKIHSQVTSPKPEPGLSHLISNSSNVIIPRTG